MAAINSNKVHLGGSYYLEMVSLVDPQTWILENYLHLDAEPIQFLLDNLLSNKTPLPYGFELTDDGFEHSALPIKFISGKIEQDHEFKKGTLVVCGGIINGTVKVERNTTLITNQIISDRLLIGDSAAIHFGEADISGPVFIGSNNDGDSSTVKGHQLSARGNITVNKNAVLNCPNIETTHNNHIFNNGRVFTLNTSVNRILPNEAAPEFLNGESPVLTSASGYSQLLTDNNEYSILWFHQGNSIGHSIEVLLHTELTRELAQKLLRDIVHIHEDKAISKLKVEPSVQIGNMKSQSLDDAIILLDSGDFVQSCAQNINAGISVVTLPLPSNHSIKI